MPEAAVGHAEMKRFAARWDGRGTGGWGWGGDG